MNHREGGITCFPYLAIKRFLKLWFSLKSCNSVTLIFTQFFYGLKATIKFLIIFDNKNYVVKKELLSQKIAVSQYLVTGDNDSNITTNCI